MTTAILLARLRALADEASAGYFTDAELYGFLDSSQTYALQNLLERLDTIKEKDPYFIYECLIPLRNVSALITSNASGVISTSTLTGLIRVLYVILSTTARTLIFCKCVDTKEIDKYRENKYLAPSLTEPACWNSGTSTLTTVPPFATTSSYVHYLKAPTAIGAGVDPTLGSDAHDAMLEYAFSLALAKDGRQTESEKWQMLALKKINDITI